MEGKRALASIASTEGILGLDKNFPKAQNAETASPSTLPSDGVGPQRVNLSIPMTISA